MTLLEDADFAVQLGERLKKTRGTISREDLAARIGVHINTYGNYERGSRVPDASFLRRFCEEFNLNSNWLLTGEEPMIHSGEEPKVEIDKALLAKVIRLVEEFYDERNETQEPAEKAESIADLYDFFQGREEKLNKETLINLTKRFAKLGGHGG